ncbi:MAG TPA: DUF4157 domain-containing protein [Pyrinomonadaceae bacterium]|nr:DUF4157 domain-containing protein [Pyrinomonadaceae bacterium]
MQTRERESGGPAHDAQPAGSSRAPGTAPAASPPFPLYETLPGQLSAGPRLQPKLTIGNPDDPFEREADGVAERVMRMPDTTVRLQRKCACGGAGGECEECASKPVSLQRRAAPHAEIDSAAPSIVGEVLRAPGQPLDASTRAFMEPRFGHDFGGVRVHTGWRAEESARSVGALAYTVGQNVVFGAGQYAPETEGGQRLLAHELAHVVQQSSATGAPQVRRTYRPNELMNPDGTPRRSNPVASGPDTNFYPASAASITGRRALVVAGIHGEEASAQALGAEADRQIASRTMATDFNTLFVPRANPGTGRAAGSGATRVPDLNREFGTNYTSPNPIANQISTMVSEFAPERVLSIHAISNRRLGGVFLDPIHSRRTLPAGATPAQQRAEDIASYPAVGTAAERESAFTGDPRNLAAMEMTERMVVATNPAVGTAATPGNAPRAGFPASRRPGTAAGASPNSLIYPLQGAMTGGVSLGVWLSGHGVPVVTIEVPGYRAGPSVWRNYLGGVREFLRIPAPTTTTTPTSTGTTTSPVVQPKLDPRRPGLSLSRAPGSVLQRQPAQITSANVPRRRGRDAAYDTFMRQVYDAQVSIWTSRGAAYTHTVPSADLMTLAAGDSLPGRTIQFDRNVGNAYLLPMLAHARTALSAARAAGDPLARNVTDIRVRSGYRPATEQLSIWNRFYDQYYTDTTTQRQALAGGEHGPDAVNFLANYINQRVFSPGYSPHQQGRTVDLTYLEGTTWATAETDAPNIATWRASWLFNWLQRNAASYAFLQNPNLNEPWHWEFNLNVAVNLLINQIRAFLRRIFPFINWGGEEGPQPTPSETPPSETPRGDAGPIQPKLEVSQPGDPFELEADAVAERVMRMPDTTVRLQRKCACGEGAGCEDCAHKSEGLQRRAAAAEHSQHNSAPDIV